MLLNNIKKCKPTLALAFSLDLLTASLFFALFSRYSGPACLAQIGIFKESQKKTDVALSAKLECEKEK